MRSSRAEKQEFPDFAKDSSLKEGFAQRADAMATRKRPVIQPANMKLRCYAQREGDQWVAVCIDFNLAAQADTYSAARRKLHEQVIWYFYDATAGDDKAHGMELLFRKAPASLLARYHVVNAMSHFRAMRERFRSFCDLVPVSVQRPATA